MRAYTSYGQYARHIYPTHHLCHIEICAQIEVDTYVIIEEVQQNSADWVAR